jgi:hypothetical protein
MPRLDTVSGEVIEEGRLRTTPEALRRRFSSEQLPLRIARARREPILRGLADWSGDRDPQKRISKEGDEMLSEGFW